MDNGPQRRKNGFERPFHTLQVISWVVFGTDVAVFAACVVPTLESTGAQIAVSACWSISVVVLVVATAIATKCDPSDRHILANKSEPLAEDDEDLAFCLTCNSYVFPRSKHCRACDKCVHVFDHHCKWLNNCVGRFNYSAFFTSISSVVVMTGIILGVCGQLLAEHFSEEEVEPRFRKIYKGAPDDLPLGILIVMLAVNLPLFLLDLQLVLLHTYLIHRQLTTFEYIMHKRTVETEQEAAPPPEGAKYQADVQPATPGGSSGSADDAQGGTEKVKKKGPQGRVLPANITTLPRCLDWFLFSKKKRKRANDNAAAAGSQPTSIPDVPEQGCNVAAMEAGPDPEAGYEDAEAGSSQRRGSGSKKVGKVVPFADEVFDGEDDEVDPWNDAPTEPVVPQVAPPPKTSSDGADGDTQDPGSNGVSDTKCGVATLGCGGSPTSVDSTKI